MPELMYSRRVRVLAPNLPSLWRIHAIAGFAPSHGRWQTRMVPVAGAAAATFPVLELQPSSRHTRKGGSLGPNGTSEGRSIDRNLESRRATEGLSATLVRNCVDNGRARRCCEVAEKLEWHRWLEVVAVPKRHRTLWLKQAVAQRGNAVKILPEVLRTAGAVLRAVGQWKFRCPGFPLLMWIHGGKRRTWGRTHRPSRLVAPSCLPRNSSSFTAPCSAQSAAHFHTQSLSRPRLSPASPGKQANFRLHSFWGCIILRSRLGLP